jgi:hypothetical protein
MKGEISQSLIAPLPDYLQKMVDDSPDLQHAVEFGIDLTLLIENLSLTPTERIRKLQAAIEVFEEFRKAGQRQRGEL